MIDKLMKALKFILLGALLLMCRHAAAQWTPDHNAYRPSNVCPVLEQVQRDAFFHFWKYGDRATGMIHASSNVRNPNLTVGGSGFGAMVLIAGAERGWITRAQAAERIVQLVRFLDKADRFHGVWPHWVDREGHAVKFGKQIKAGDLVETSFMMMGLYCAAAYFDGDSAAEQEIREATERFRNSIEWNFYTNGGGPDLFWLWESTTGAFNLPLRGYNEALITYILALGAPDEHAVPAATYRTGWLQDGRIERKGRQFYGYPMPLGGPYGGPMFLSHYTFMGIDPHVLEDDYVNYFHNGIRHAMVNRHYCIHHAPHSYRYDAFNWGLTACSGPVGKGYAARTPQRDDGVIAPTAALSSIVYTPFYSTQVLLNIVNNYPRLKSDGGPGDAYSLVDDWFFRECIAIDQAPIVIMIENYRSGLFWRLLAGHPDIVRGLERAGMHRPVYTTGFQHVIADVSTGLYDLMMHPDRERYELDFYLGQSGAVAFTILDTVSGALLVESEKTVYPAGEHVFAFTDKNLRPETVCTIEMTVDGAKAASVAVKLH